MPGEDKQQQTQTQQSKTDPWAPAAPALMDLISKYSSINTGVTGGQTSALNKLNTAVSGLPDFSGAGTGALTDLFGATTAPQVGMLSSALGQLNSNIGGTARGEELDPYSTPGFSDALSTMTSDITNKVKGVYNASGRAPSGAGSFAKSLGRGLTEGIAPVIASQFNTNNTNRMGAAKTLYDATGGTAGAITGQEQIPLANKTQALGLIPSLMQAFTAPAQTQLGAADTGYNQQFKNLQQLLGPIMGIAGLGNSSSGSGTSTTVQPQSTMGNVIGGASSAIGLLSLLSDERAKDNIEEVGELHDGQPVYRYTYKGSNVPQIGLLAQEVLETAPEAVEQVGGMLRVNYGRATDRAAAMRKAA